jgi:putative transport protein
VEAFTRFLAEHPLITLFAVIGLGYLIGRIRVAGFSLGISAVLFVGLAVGALGPEVALPDFVYLFGLVVFVYTVGVAAGPGFVAAMRRRGAGQNAVVVIVLAGAGGVALAGASAAGLNAPVAAGVFAGALTNTPALAAVLESAGPATTRLTDPVVGYSIAYPFGVLGMIVAVGVIGRLWGRGSGDEGSQATEDLTNLTVVLGPGTGGTLAALLGDLDWRVVASRHRSHEVVSVPGPDTELAPGDLLTLVGPTSVLPELAGRIGEISDEELPFDRNELDFRRVFVSEEAVVGRHLADLGLAERFGAVVTRIRRGDVDVLARPGMVLEPGDRLRVVAPRNRMAEVSAFFGDSFRRLSEIDAASFSLGVTLGLLVGLIPFPLPGGAVFRLGFAGGPLIVGLVLGALERTGPIAWQLPYNANLTLRQLGAILFLAGVGTRSGYDFAQTLRSGDGLPLLAVGMAITTAAAIAMLVAGRYLLKLPPAVLAGVVAGMQTQPAVLAFAVEQEGNETPNTGYVTVIPVAMVAKILLAQVVLALA